MKKISKEVAELDEEQEPNRKTPQHQIFACMHRNLSMVQYAATCRTRDEVG